MTTGAMPSVRVSRTIRADPETLFRAWTEPEFLMRWWCLDEPGWAFDSASVDLKVGGHYRLGMTGPDGKKHVANGKYCEIDRPSRLSFTWDWEEPEAHVGETLVTVEFNDAGTGRTDVVVTHERFKDPARMGRHREGWMQVLERLDNAVG